MAKSRRSPNNFLASLSPSDFELLQPHLKLIELRHESVLFERGTKVKNVYFPHSGIISLVVPLRGGRIIEAAMVGRDSNVGASSALDGRITLNRGIVQLPGAASVMSAAPFRKAAEQSNAFRSTLVRHEQVLFVQAQQSAACNATHRVEARLARWLLRARDLFSEDTMPLTQEFLSQMLGVQRSSVSGVANSLQQLGLINYNRGRVQITNLQGLRMEACECYIAIKSQYDRLLSRPH
jgi:CRP-like cAMP-binding protein